jgi:hypothetical protein
MSFLELKIPEDPSCKCGVSWLITMTPRKFRDACMWHDAQYTLHHLDMQDLTRSEIDLKFYELMRKAAGKSTRLRLTATLFYRFTRIFGGIVWRANNKKP